jgi:hypothetical protein
MVNQDNNSPTEVPDFEQQNAADVISAGDSGSESHTRGVLHSKSKHKRWTLLLVLAAGALLVFGIGLAFLAIYMGSRDANECLTYAASETEVCQHSVSIFSQLAPAASVVAVGAIALGTVSLIGGAYFFRSQRKRP